MTENGSTEEIYVSRNLERVWGIVKFNPNFAELIYNEPECVIEKLNRVCNLKLSKADVTIERLITEATNLLKAPPAVRHGYSLYIRFDIHSKTKLFSGFYLVERNLELLKENFVLELTPAPDYYVEKVLDALKDGNDVVNTLKKVSNALNDQFFFEIWVHKVEFKRVLQIFIDSYEFVSENYQAHLMEYVSKASEFDWSQVDRGVIMSALHLLDIDNVSRLMSSFVVTLFQYVVDKLPEYHDFLSEKLDFEKILNLLLHSEQTYYYSFVRVLFFLWQMADEITFEQLKVISCTEKWVQCFKPIVENVAHYQHMKLTQELSKLCAGRMAYLTEKSKIRPNIENVNRITDLIRNIGEISPSSSYRLSKSVAAEFSLARDSKTFEAALCKTPPGLMAIEFIESALSDEDQELFDLATKGPLCPEDWCITMSDLISKTFKTMKNTTGGMRLCPLFLLEANPLPQFLKSLAILFNQTWLEVNNKKESVKNVLEVTQIKIRSCLETYPLTVAEWSRYFREHFDSEFSRNEVELLKQGRNDLEKRWRRALSDQQLPNIKSIIKETYSKPLKQGIVLQKLPKDIDRLLERETLKKEDKLQYRRWRLSTFEDVLFYRDCTENGEDIKNGEKAGIRIDEIKHIIHGPDFLAHANISKFENLSFQSGIFNSLKKRKSHPLTMPKGLVLQTVEDTYEMICDNEDILGKIIKTLNILCCKKYPERDVETLLNIQVETRLFNLKVLKLEKVGPPKETEQNSAKTAKMSTTAILSEVLPKSSTISSELASKTTTISSEPLQKPSIVASFPKSYYDWIPKDYHNMINPKKVLRLNHKKATIPSFNKNVTEVTYDYDLEHDSSSDSSDL